MQQNACSNLDTSGDSPASRGKMMRLKSVSFCRCITLTERPSREGQGDVAEADGGPPCLAAISNADKLQNRDSLQPLSLPLEIRAFSKLPVIVCAKSPGQCKAPSQLCAALSEGQQQSQLAGAGRCSLGCYHSCRCRGARMRSIAVIVRPVQRNLSLASRRVCTYC